MNITITHYSNIFTVTDRQANHLFSKGFGKKLEQVDKTRTSPPTFKIVLDPLEVLYIYEHKKNVKTQEFTISSREEFLQEHSLTYELYLVYSDLLLRGYHVKQALKFGAHFRIYNKQEKTNEKEHSTHLVFVYNSRSSTINAEDLFSINRVAHSTKKHILLAFVDAEHSISYLEQRRWK